MKGSYATFWSESLKIRRSKILWITIIAFSFIPIMMGFLMYILKNPEFARKTGLLAAKAQIAGAADWPSYFGMLSQAISIGGIIGFGFIASWIFGREYSDRTIKDLLALPISRSTIVTSKFIILAIWSVLLSAIVFVLGLIIGAAINLPLWSVESLIHGFKLLSVSTLFVISISTPVAFFASYGRGYLPPLGFNVLAIIIAQVIGAIGYGQYFLWTIFSMGYPFTI